MDEGVVGAGKIDALENAALLFQRLQDLNEGDLALRGDQHQFAGRQFLHFRARNVEGRLDRGTFGSGHRVFLVEVIEAGSDPVGVPHDEAPAASQGAAERVGAVQSRQKILEGGGEDSLLPFRAGTPRLLHLVGEPLAHKVPVRHVVGMLAKFCVGLEERSGIGEVEVARQKERLLKLRLLVQEGMAEVLVVAAVGGVAQVS